MRVGEATAHALLGGAVMNRMQSTPEVRSDASALLPRQSFSCGLFQIECGDGCMPLGSTCCEEYNTYCRILETCHVEGTCCPIGATCTGKPSCDEGKVRCGYGCIPADAECCSNGTYCEAGTTCTAEGCVGNGSGGDDDDDDTATTSTTTSIITTTSSTATTTSSSPPTTDFDDNDDDDDDYDGGADVTRLPPTATATPTPTPTPTSTSTSTDTDADATGLPPGETLTEDAADDPGATEPPTLPGVGGAGPTRMSAGSWYALSVGMGAAVALAVLF